MDPILVIAILAGLVILLLTVGAPLKPIRFVGQLAVKLVIGALMLFFVNAFGSFFAFHIPINGVTALVSGVLGIPGLLLLIVTKQFIL
ncbi:MULTISPECIES: pro-sigmaK processing inhibitor BofA family protein [Alkalihalophilus]|jgi:inhibitor of the pro-sigma K processing machinery|uniref:Pro-sigmaK processing inhibitor BofA n=3 Tax=Alkalihalophilus TaxID=2893060 RepID=D3FQX7_ALKPO|nr:MULTISPECIES: pro-sigmaK processing inhibitor BofA family protein [Alkalihalophilus]ADC49673.1 hypothetical protein BpOF4_08075 [Alkalihalophilus pseudofirmus OF4]ERN53500.1 pro-sigmaK processing inhibitor BofA [Alkalihalophilus marmarensis DSM 21297]MCM3491673.1 pro-sigmaK processing inhibitor BofA family protein [Alkalihalophilus marmarensis]MDV2887413.1 pro-sigmaK processing inhibitor BofA family protein [Alkalihalophilus pseudofirmus]MEC2074282.1 pro-sigmaK processing inhibitor BofA fam